MLARRIGTLLDQLAGISVQFDAQTFCNSFAFSDQIVEQITSRFEMRCSAVMQKCQCSHRICSCVENELGPLRSARIRQSDSVHPGASHEACKFFDFLHGRVARLEWSDP